MGGLLEDFQDLVSKSKFHSFGDMDLGYIRSQSTVVTGEVMAAVLICAEGLVAHGCFDGVLLGIGEEGNTMNLASDTISVSDEDDETYVSAITVLSESIYNCFLETEAVELATLKFLLTSGCRTITSRVDGGTEAMLQGTHLLQAIRVCYRLYLSTDSAPNKTTAKAALRQIVTSTFKRLESKDKTEERPCMKKGESIRITFASEGEDPFSHAGYGDDDLALNKTETDDKSRFSAAGNFPSFEHKDAYLVMRSLCKLSMKAVSTNPEIASYLSTPVVISRNESSGAINDATNNRSSRDFPSQPILMDPALDSKILALDLILEILQRTKTEIFMNAGPHLIYAVRNYLCHSLLKNCTSDSTYVVNLSLQLFVPLFTHFRSHLKPEIEAFVTNVFFVILDSKNSTVEHKLRVVVLFEEICSDSATLAEIFLNYDCDLSAVDLFQRIVNTLAKVAKIDLHDQGMESTGLFVGSAGATRAEKTRQEHRALRLEAMKAVRKILASLYTSIVASPMIKKDAAVDDEQTSPSSVSSGSAKKDGRVKEHILIGNESEARPSCGDAAGGVEKQSLVQIYDSKKKRKEDFAKVILKFNQKPKAGIKLAAEVGLLNEDDPSDVAQFLLVHKDSLDKTQTGEFLGMDAEYKGGFMLKVLNQYANAMDFAGLPFDDAIKMYLSGFRLPGEAQKIDRIMEKFAERYTTQNTDVFPTADAAFILAFSVIMLNTDLHNPAIKEERRMTRAGFVRNNSGICDGQDLPEEFLTGIFDRIKTNPISLKEDDERREKVGISKPGDAKSTAASLFVNNYEEIDKKRENDYQRERDEILRNTESLLRRKTKKGKYRSFRGSKHFVSTQDSGLKDEYVIPMFDVTWGPALAVFSTVIESANGTMGALLSIATDNEIESAAENAAEATEVCLEGFTLAIRIAALCGNDTARCAYVHALSNFSLLGSGRLLEHRHIRCVQALLELGRDDGELLGPSWEYMFKALSEVARLNQVYEAGAKYARAELAAKARQKRREDTATRRAAEFIKRGDSFDDNNDEVDEVSESDDSDYLIDFDNMLEDDIYDGHFGFDESLDNISLDEINARSVHENLPDDLSDEIFSRSSSLSTSAIKDFTFQLCRVSRMEIAGYGGGVGNRANDVDLTAVHYRKHHSLVSGNGGFGGKQNQPDIYCLQKLIEVTHYNMDTRPRLVFSEIWNSVSGHLTSTALHSNAAVAIYAVDSFRQLSMQFLKREELGVFEFQRKFIKPFEGIMLKCTNTSVKEFLLKSVEQIILMHGDTENVDDGSSNAGLLKSGWRPLLAVIGQASSDDDEIIAKLGFQMLTAQLRQSLKVKKMDDYNSNSASNVTFAVTTPMRADKFVDLVEALLMYVSGPREDMSTESIDHLVTLCRYLADDSIPLPQNCKPNHLHPQHLDAPDTAVHGQTSSSRISANEELELWWPVLLGLSRSVGDVRPNIRIKGLVTLLAIINQHFFVAPSQLTTSTVLGDLQTLQLIFRGILTPSLEHADCSSNGNGGKLSLPDGFIRFMTRGSSLVEVGKGGRKERIEGQREATGNNWLDTTFDHLMDGTVAIALRSMQMYGDDVLVEEILAMFNTCLISDSTSLAIRGLKRLYHFVANDLVLERITDKTWATVSHMLRRCLAVSGIPFNPQKKGNVEWNSEIINDFLQEEQLLPQRRYIGSNATSVIGSLLTDKEIAKRMGVQWYMFLYSGLGMGIRIWDKAAEIVDMHPLQGNESMHDIQPPQHAENSLYARKWLVRLLLKLISGEDLLFGSNSTTDKASKSLLRDEMDSLINAYLKKEAVASKGNATPGQVLELEHMTKMVCNLLEGIAKLDSSRLTSISSLTPTLSGCIQTDDRCVRKAVHKVLQRIFQLNEEQK